MWIELKGPWARHHINLNDESESRARNNGSLGINGKAILLEDIMKRRVKEICHRNHGMPLVYCIWEVAACPLGRASKLEMFFIKGRLLPKMPPNLAANLHNDGFVGIQNCNMKNYWQTTEKLESRFFKYGLFQQIDGLT